MTLREEGFDEDELRLIAELDAAEGLDAPDTGGNLAGGGSGTGDDTTTDDDPNAGGEAQGQTQQAGEAGATTTTDGQPAPKDDKPAPAGGDIGVALAKERDRVRAARRAERQAQQENAQLRNRLAELEAKSGAGTAESGSVEDVVAQLKDDLPDVAKKFEDLQRENLELKGKLKPEPAPAFVPAVLTPEVQAAVDSVDALAEWQMDSDQTMWDLAVTADQFLRASPKWAKAPVADRLAEATRIALEQADSKQQAAAPTPSDPKAQARAAINAAPRTQPMGLGDLRGGASPTTSGPRYSNDMTDEQIIASL